MPLIRHLLAAVLGVFLACASSGAHAGRIQGPVRLAQATPEGPAARPGWPEEKCRRYRSAWETLSSRTGRRGLGADFVARHEAFIASGCMNPGDVCPRSPEELEAANMLTIMAMNAGMASTFLPFGCPRNAAGRS